MTAAAFVRGFLDLEGELTPILASLVRTVYASSLLDDADPASDVMTRIKKRLMKALTTAIDPRQPVASAVTSAAGAHSESEPGSLSKDAPTAAAAAGSRKRNGEMGSAVRSCIFGLG
jgi:hypothetical protein